MKEANATKIIKALIEVSGSKLMSVTFTTKTTGKQRVMQFNPKSIRGLMGEKASKSARQGAATRAARHPDLINVIDHALVTKGVDPMKAWRSFDGRTVSQVKVGGIVVPLC